MRRAAAVIPPEFAQLEAYWAALRVGGAIPPRSAIEPRGIAGLLDRTVLIERIAPCIARIRLAGMALVDLMGMDLRGMPVSALIAPDAREAVGAAIEAVFSGPARGDLLLEGERGIGRPALAGRLLLLPLIGRSGLVDRAIGVMVLDGRAGRAPRRFVLARALHKPVGGPASAGPAPGAGGVAAGAPEAAGFAEPGADWQPFAARRSGAEAGRAAAGDAAPGAAQARRTEVPYLRLVRPDSD
ncbi:MAG: PAS domain-containing protein [Gemmobacter sp.]